MGISEACDHLMESTELPQYKTRELGIPLLIVNSIKQNRCKLCGEVTHTIPYPDRLIAAAAVGRAKIPLKLSGAEIRFMRKALGLPAKDMAETLGVKAETISRWENEKMPMTPTYEKYLRLVVGTRLSQAAPAVDFKTEDIVGMAIKSVRHIGEEIVMAFELIRFKMAAKDPTTDAYTEERKQAA